MHNFETVPDSKKLQTTAKMWLSFPKQGLVFTCLQYKSSENTVGKGENARNKEFLLFPVFSTHLENFPQFSSNLKLSSANSLNLEESKICRLGKGQSILRYKFHRKNCGKR